VRRRADDLDAALERLVVRAGADEGRQQRVVDVDDPVRHPADEVVAEDLHVAGQHHQVDPLGLEQLDQAGLLAALSPSTIGTWWNGTPKKRQVSAWSGWLLGDEGDVGVQLAGPPAGQQVEQAVRLPARPGSRRAARRRSSAARRPSRSAR
jgi:hypothetical protein